MRFNECYLCCGTLPCTKIHTQADYDAANQRRIEDDEECRRNHPATVGHIEDLEKQLKVLFFLLHGKQ